MSQSAQPVRFNQPMTIEEFYADEENAVRGEKLFAACFRGVELVGEITAQKTLPRALRQFSGSIVRPKVAACAW